MIHADMARNCIEPRQHGPAWLVGVAHPVDAKPGILQHVAGVVGIPELSRKEAVKLWAELLHQRSRRGLIGLLISHHEILDGGGPLHLLFARSVQRVTVPTFSLSEHYAHLGLRRIHCIT